MSTGTPTLAVLGWSDRAERLLPQLHAQGGFTVAGVGDRSATALIRARQATNAPCFQHTAEMVRRLDYDALLIADGASGSDLAGAAAARGAQLIAVADALPAAALGAAATAAVRHGVALALSRPLLHEPAIEALLSLLEDDPDWRPALAGIELRGPRPVEEQLRDAVALASGLLATSPLRVTAAAAPAANHLAAQLRYDEQALVVVGVTADVEQHASIRIEAPAGVASATVPHDAPASLRTEAPNEPPSVRQFAPEDTLAADAARIVATLAGDPADLRRAQRESAVLGALESALVTGQTHHVAAPDVRATLRVLAGGADGVSAPSGRLRLLEREAAG